MSPEPGRMPEPVARAFCSSHAVKFWNQSISISVVEGLCKVHQYNALNGIYSTV